jgi:putative FmdB family regulatory protein
MPIYEFYCPQCHTIFSFFSRTVNTDKRPACPGCKSESLERRVSRFATVSRSSSSTDAEGGGEAEGLDNLPIDEAKMERAVESLASEAEGMSEDDPRAAARLMRKLSDMTGLQYNDKMQEALNRLEAGEDPEAIESQMGESLEGDENPFVMPGGGKKGGAKRRLPPRRDETLYEM